MKKRLVVAIDGHDGAGKTTLARALASGLRGTAVRPFSGSAGHDLIRAGNQGDVDGLLNIGSAAISKALSSAPTTVPIVLDRGWMTVASFVPHSSIFFARWNAWIPTILCWVDLETTLVRLASRQNEKPECMAWHQHYLSVYMDLARRSGSPILRTDRLELGECISKLLTWAKAGPAPPSLANPQTSHL